MDPRVKPEDDGVEVGDDDGEVGDDDADDGSARSGWPSRSGEKRLPGSVTGFGGSLPVTGFSVRPTVISSRLLRRKSEPFAGSAMSRPMSSRSGLAKREPRVDLPP